MVWRQCDEVQGVAGIRFPSPAAKPLTHRPSALGIQVKNNEPNYVFIEAQSRLGHETFAFDPASNLIDPDAQREADRARQPRPKALDNLLKQYAGTHYQYDARGNLTQRWRNGETCRYTWDLFDRLTHTEDARLAVRYTYDALGRRLSKHSQAHYQERREAGPHWNRAERVKHNRELHCGFTLYGWDGDTLAWESRIADEEGLGARTTHYVYEPGSFVPLAQAVREDTLALLDEPVYGDYYRQDEDPLWLPPPPAPPIDRVAWYQCDHLGTPQEVTDEKGEIAWAAEYRAWGVAREAIRKASGPVPVTNPIRFQGQYHDQETGLHYNRYRYYDPEVGRFISKDPVGYAGGVNLFLYAPNPLGWVDPLGLSGTLAGRLADKAQRLPASQRPNTVAVIVSKDGRIVVGRNQGGVTNPEVQGVLKDIPPNEFDAQCAEVNAIARARNKGIDLTGATISVANVRGKNSTSGVHGTDKAPCSVCNPLLKKFKMNLIQRCSHHE